MEQTTDATEEIMTEKQTLQELLEDYLTSALDVAGDKVIHDRDRPVDYSVNTFGGLVILELFDDASSEPFLELSVSPNERCKLYRKVYTDGVWHTAEERSTIQVLSSKTSQEAASFFVKRIDEMLRK